MKDTETRRDAEGDTARGAAGTAAAGEGEGEDEGGGLATARTDTGAEPMRDVTGYELAAWVPLVGLIVLLGLWPKVLLSITDPVVQSLLGAR